MTPFDFSQCPGYCERARQIMLCQTHPLIRARTEEPGPSLIPVDQALAMRLEDEEELVEMLANTRVEIKILRDCAGAQV
jgi:hypothetical protein